jgi:preprotein translocase subunit Sec61beta
MTGPKDEEEARKSPRAVAAAAILLVVVLGAVGLFFAVLFSRACA